MSTETAKAPEQKWMETQEYKDILARHESLVDKGEIALLELTPAATNSKGQNIAFGGFSVMGKIRDKYKNVVLNTAIPEDRIGIAPYGVAFRYDRKDDLRYIYAILNCPILRSKIVLKGETPIKHQTRFILSDAEKESLEYAEKRELNIKYLNLIYATQEDTIDFLCNSVGLNTKGTLGVKRADLCTAWENDEAKKEKIKKLLDSEDLDYYKAAYTALKEGNAQESTGIYKTVNGVYKHNEQILGNSIENVVAYLKTNDDVYFAVKKGAEVTEKAKAVKKPK